MVIWEWTGETEVMGKTQKLMLTNGTQTFGTYLHIKPEKALKKSFKHTKIESSVAS